MRSDDDQAPVSQPTVSAKPPPRSGFARLWPAIRHSVEGLVTTFRTETAFRQELAAMVVLLPAALWLGVTTTERVALIIPLFLVLIVELLNTGLEKSVDRGGLQYNELAKAAKDAGSAAVFLSLLLVAVVWAVVLLLPLL